MSPIRITSGTASSRGTSTLTWSWSIVCCVTIVCSIAHASDDWPMWRHDAGHSAATSHSLPGQLQPQWSRDFGPREQVWDDPLNNDLMPYDRIFEPVVKDGRMFIGFNDSDKVVALNLADGRQLWSYYTDGPVRFPPVAWHDRVIFVSDDGFLHCVNAIDGSPIWKVRGGPSNRKVLGNKRVISAWPARGGPVIADDVVYFAASIWPLMGTFIYAVDPIDGRVIWVNDGTSADYIKQPHSAPSFAGVAPQGTLTVAGDRLLVPGGRSVPAVFDRLTGDLKYFHFNEGGKGNGGSFVIANRDKFHVHTRERGVREHDLVTGTRTAFMVNEPVLTEDFVYAAGMNDDQPVVRAYDVHDVDEKTQKKMVWEVAADGQGDLILAGDRLYAAGDSAITMIELNTDRSQEPKLAGSLEVTGEVRRLLAANGRLVTVTLDGRIQAYGESDPDVVAETSARNNEYSDADREFATSLVGDIGSHGGYILWFGAEDPARIAAVVQQSELRIVIVNDDVETVDRLREVFDSADLYGKRASVHLGTPASYLAPFYIANAVIISGGSTERLLTDKAELRAAFDSVRPYGSSLIVLRNGQPSARIVDRLQQAQLENADIRVADHRVIATRVGALTGAANWTHQYGDVANTVKSNDSRVKLPLGVLWFGGNSNADILPRHSHGPPEQVVDGRLYLEGMNSLSCRDVYTGRVLWERTFEDLGTFDVYYDDTYKETPLSTTYNQVHIPGANGRGTNYVVTSDAIYLAIGSRCHVLDPKNGKTVRTISLPAMSGDQPQWGYIGVTCDVLLAGNGFANYRSRHALNFDESDGELKRNARGFGSKSFDISASAGLIAFDRHSGERLWQVDARHSFLHNGIVAGDGLVFCLDRLPAPVEAKLKRRGKATPDTCRIVAVDMLTGNMVWENHDDVFGSWLGYSTEHHLLLQAGAAASDRLRTEVRSGMAVHRGKDGSIKWREDDRAYSGPCILHGTTILTNANSYKLSAGAFRLLDGRPELTTNPLTGMEQEWQVCRAYGCNNIIASENLLTFRSGAAGFYDLKSRGGTGNLGGFKSGCSSNLVVANGILNAPDFTRTCSCAYQNQTSLGLVHMPEMELWTVNQEAWLAEPGQRLDQIGINFGAPGDRMGSKDTLWIEYPHVGDQHANLDITIEGDPTWYRHSSLNFHGDGPAWVGASGVLNATRVTIPMSIGRPESDDATGSTTQTATTKSNGGASVGSGTGLLTGEDGPRSPAPSLDPQPHTVRLHFSEPDQTTVDGRIFSVALQGRQVIENLDIVGVTGGPQRTMIREFKHVSISDQLTIDLSAHRGRTILSGVEIVREHE
jgi:outer membrane protein assembly factor BamB